MHPPSSAISERRERMQPRIKIFTRSFDLKLYLCSKGLFRQMGVPCVRLTDKSADGYFYSMLRDMECDIAINVDEDAFIIDPDAVTALALKVWEEGYANAGCSDGDPAVTGRDPVVTNPFFNVLNLTLIRTRFDRRCMERRFSDCEPYYPFFRWMAENFRTLYLPATRHSDGISTIAFDTGGHPICLHSWFSRFYSMPSFVVRRIEPSQGMQRERIDALIREAYCSRGLEVPRWNIADRLRFAADKTVRWAIKIPQRISRWPYKIKRKFALSRKKQN